VTLRATLTLTLALLAAPLAAEAQQAGKVWRIGYLEPSGPDRSNFEAFREGLRDLGYAEGSNVTIVFRSGEADFARLKALAAELATSRVDVIVAGGTEGVAATRQATATIPIVMRIAADPVASGFVASLARPGGNITGLSGLEHGLYASGWNC
jgi:putative tryptophan/tyrosine transport system substrate-binding protein